MVSFTLLSIASLSFMKMMDVWNRGERGVASNLNLSSIEMTLDILFSSEEACKKSGLVGLKLDPQSPSGTPVQLHTPGATGPGPVFLSEGMIYDGTRRIDSLRFTSIEAIGTPVYFATLELKSSITGQAITSRSGKKAFNIRLTLDNTNTVISCSRGLAAAPSGFNLNVFSNPGTYSFTVPAGVTSINVEVWGGGGGGCGGNGGAGGGGGYSQCNFTVSPSQIFTVIVGSGGGGSVGPYGYCYSSDGLLSEFNGNSLDCSASGGTRGNGEGGVGGRGYVTGANSTISLEGGTGGDLTCPSSMDIAAGGSAPRGGDGGRSPGPGSPNAEIHMSGKAPGGGGGATCGFTNPGAYNHGGSGAPGAVHIRW